MVEEINKLFNWPMKIKFEKVYLPCALLSKKRYVGLAFEALKDESGFVDAKGIETIRKDSCEFVSDTLLDCLKIAFKSRSSILVAEKVFTVLESAMRNHYGLEKFVLTCEFKTLGFYARNSKSPALQVSK